MNTAPQSAVNAYVRRTLQRMASTRTPAAPRRGRLPFWQRVQHLLTAKFASVRDFFNHRRMQTFHFLRCLRRRQEECKSAPKYSPVRRAAPIPPPPPIEYHINFEKFLEPSTYAKQKAKQKAKQDIWLGESRSEKNLDRIYYHISRSGKNRDRIWLHLSRSGKNREGKRCAGKKPPSINLSWKNSALDKLELKKKCLGIFQSAKIIPVNEKSAQGNPAAMKIAIPCQEYLHLRNCLFLPLIFAFKKLHIACQDFRLHAPRIIGMPAPCATSFSARGML